MNFLSFHHIDTADAVLSTLVCNNTRRHNPEMAQQTLSGIVSASDLHVSSQ